MGIGASVALIAIGAILMFATDFDVYGLDIDTIGLILMVTGGLGLAVTAVIFGSRRRPEPSWPSQSYPPAPAPYQAPQPPPYHHDHYHRPPPPYREDLAAPPQYRDDPGYPPRRPYRDEAVPPRQYGDDVPPPQYRDDPAPPPAYRDDRYR